MIKKLNIALLAAFAAMLSAKCVKSLFPPRDGAARASAPASAPECVPAPNVYYQNWSSFAVENKAANRNGILLDTIRAVFPSARFVHLRADAETFAKVLREDPLAVVVGFGRHRALEGVGVAAQIPLAYSKLAVMTSRANPWRYRGAESLAGLRIATTDSYLDFPVVKSALAARGTPEAAAHPVIVVVDDEKSKEDLGRMVESGEADAFFVTCDGITFMPDQMSATILQRFRISAPIDSGDVLMRVSNVDPAVTAAILDAYEKGMRRIEKSGERRRIFAYYGYRPRPIDAEPAEK